MIMKSASCFALFMSLSCAFADTRSVCVDSVEMDSAGRIASVDLRLTAGSLAALHVAWGAEAAGDDIDDWDSSRPVALIPGSQTVYTYEFPKGIGDDVKAARFFLLEEYDLPIAKRYGWICTDGGQVIDTEFVPSGNSAVEMKFSLNSVSESAALFCARTQGSSADSFTAFYIAGEGWRFDYFSTGAAVPPVAVVDKVYELRADRTGIYLDGDCISGRNAVNREAGYRLLLFGARYGRESSVQHTASLKMHSMKAWSDSDDETSVVLDLVPTEKDGVTCVYNRVDGKYLNEYCFGETRLTHGDEVGIDRPDVLSRTEVLTGKFGAERTVQVVATQRSDLTRRLSGVDLAITQGMDRKLYVAYGAKDKGEDMVEWDSVRYVADIPGETTEYSFAVPDSWGTDIAAMRFFLCDREYVPGCDEICEGVTVNNVYVKTGFTPTYGSILDTTLSFSSIVDSQTIFCARGTAKTPRSMTLFYIGGTGWRLDRNNKMSSSEVKAAVSAKYVIRAEVSGLMVNGASVPLGNEDIPHYTEAGSTLALFKESYEGRPENGKYPFTGTIYAFKAWQDSADPGSVKLDLVTCIKDSKPCLYNRVDGGFLDFEGTGTAIAVGIVANGSPLVATKVLNINPPGFQMVVR